MTLKIGHIDRIKIVKSAIDDLRIKARAAQDAGMLLDYSNLMLDLAALELVLTNETEYYLKAMGDVS